MTRRALLAAAASAALLADRKNRAPVSHETLRVKIPETQPITLSNGMTLLVVEYPRVPLAWLRIQVDGAGKVFQTRPGLAQATAEMLRQGTRNRSGREITEQSAQLGAMFSSGTTSNRETATIDVTGLSSQFNGWQALAADALINPVFPSDEFTSWRQRQISNTRMSAGRPATVAANRLMALCYGTHPAGLGDPSATELAALTPEMLTEWHRQRYTPANSVVTVIGRVRAGDVAAASEKLFGSWKTPELRVELPSEPQRGGARRIVLIDRPGAPQSEVYIGGLLFDRRNPDFFSMLVLDALLGGGNISRLDFALQRRNTHPLGVISEYGTPRYTGYWRVRLSVGTASTIEGIKVVLDELRRLCDEQAPANELEEAKASISGRFAIDLEQPPLVISYSYQRYRYGFSSDYWERYSAKISAVAASEVQSVAQKYYNPDAAHIVVVGDAARIRSGLAKIGPIES